MHRSVTTATPEPTAPHTLPTVVRYRDVLRVPHAARLLISTLMGRLPSGMAPLAIVLTGPDDRGYGSAGMLAAVYLLANAAGGPPLGRLIDRLGQTRVLTVSALVAGAGFALILVDDAQMLGAVVAGLSRPPLDATLRCLWKPLMPSREHERVALSLDAATQELIYIAGPLLAAAVAWATSAQWALLATAAVGLSGTLLVVTSPPSRAWRPTPRTADWLGPLRAVGLRRLYAAMVCAGVPMGAIVPVAVQTADRWQAPGLAGALPAVVSVGAAIGGLVYGTRSWPGSASGHLTVLCAVWAAGWLPLLAATGPATAVAAGLLPGAAMAPLLSAAYLITGHLAPDGTTTEAGALLVAALDIGCAVGTAAAGTDLGLLLLPAGGTAAFLLLAARPIADRPLLPPTASAEARKTS
ncbi:MFS transporter [Streptomyces sp. bgisy154]|uniref:MFS transporter n=1 Tax=Streptomyces sp. bgisy154 TaxID=3413794 RepID=UPI003D75FAF8